MVVTSAVVAVFKM